MKEVRDIISFLAQTISEIVVAYLVAIVAGTTSGFSVAKIILAIKLNVFAIPLLPAMDFPLWILYVVFVMWISKWVQMTQYTGAEITEQVESDITSLYYSAKAKIQRTQEQEETQEENKPVPVPSDD